jgi:branched-subunit amino acid permease
MNLIYTIMFHIVAIFLNYSISKNVDKVGEFETLGSTIISIDSRYLKNL